MGKHGPNPWQARQRTPWRDWQAAKRQYREQPPRPSVRRRGIMTSPLPMVAALLLLGGLFWAMSEKNSLPLITTEVVRGTALFTVCQGKAEANCVIDGDTLYISGEKVRLAGIDAPEIFNPACPMEKMIGLRAQRRLLELVNRHPFSLESSPGADEDRYGRKLRVLTRDGRSLGATLIFEGLASAQDRNWCPA